MLRVLRTEPIAWWLGAFYFLTFGGFVAFSIYLPTLLKAQFGLTPADAGFRAAGFVVLATFMRPLGGWLADRIGGAQVLSWVFGGVALFSLLLMWPSMVPFTVGALACASLLGLGNGAVFKLVPERFPRDTGTVTGLVGALGGLGGFFPPLVLGVFRDSIGVIWPGFIMLSATALGLRLVNQRLFHPADVDWRQNLPPASRRAVDRVRAGSWATFATLLLAAAIVIGSRTLAHFDAALVGYTFATLFATFGITYRYAMWLERPPTRMYWRRGWAAFLSRAAHRAERHRPGPSGSCRTWSLTRFIFRRDRLRGITSLADHVGLPAGGGHHLSAGVGLGALRDRAWPPRDLPHVHVRRGRAGLPGGFAAGVHHLPRPRVVVVPGDCRRHAGVPPPDDRPRRDGGPAVRPGHPAAAAAVRHQRHGADADGQLHVDARLRLRVPGHPARHHGDRHA